MDWLKTLMSSQGFIPHGHCYLWKPELVWLHLVGDGAIALAYFSIPVLLICFVAKRQDIPFNWVFLLFGGFIVSCGAGHLMDIWTLWHPTYWLAGVLKAMTAGISVYTALELISLLPVLLALPSPAQLEAANRDLAQALLKLQQTQAQLVQTEKMSSLGQLVAGIAHEINNPVNFIHGNLKHAEEYTQDLLHLLNLYQQFYVQPAPAIVEAIESRDLAFIQQDFPKTLASMQLGANRIRQLVLSLRNFSRLDEAEMKPVNIHEGIDSTLLILHYRLKPTGGHAGIVVQKDYGQIPLVECYAGQLNQVFMNILSNAIDAIEEHRQSEDTAQSNPACISISTALLPADKLLPAEKQCSNKINCVQIKIADTGPGISEAVQKQLFNPFFTTKPVGKGTGLGLSISRQIVEEKHSGSLACDSAPGQGTVFLIQIPIGQTRAAAPSQQPALAPAH